MNRDKAHILDQFVSPKILSGPSATPASAPARAALKADPRYHDLRRRLGATRFFQPAPWDYVGRFVAIVALYAGGMATLFLDAPLWLRVLGMLAVGFAVVQSSFFAHEAAHGAVTRSNRLVEAIGQAFDTFMIGYDFAYFRRSHDLHHFHTNEEAVDPDGLSTLFSVNATSARAKTAGLGRLLTRWQAVLLPFLYSLWAFTMRWDGILFLARGWRKHKLDIAVMVLHVACFLVAPMWLVGVEKTLLFYAGWSVVAGFYLGVIIPINHVGMPYWPATQSPGFIEQQVTSSRDIAGPRLYDYLFIGLNMQVAHHLFPFVPTTRLREANAVIEAFCRDHSLPYTRVGWLEANAQAFAHLAEVAQLVRPQAQLEEQPPAEA
jgi:fatty acid desaturase